jgi:hypothetical protein
VANAGVIPTEALKLITGFPCLPRFVVMTITPFAALEPYRDEAAASFRTVMDSISLGLMELITLLEV